VVTCSYSGWDANAFGLVRVAVTPTTLSTLALTFTVTAAQRDPDLSNNSRTGAVQVVQPTVADVSIELPSIVQGYAGQSLTFFVAVGNAGPADATGVRLTLQFPSGLSPADPTGCTATAASWTCSYPLGDVGVRTFLPTPVTVYPAAAGSFTVSGQVSAAEPDPDSSNNSDTGAVMISPAADLSVQIAESADPVTPGQPLTYTVTVGNAGPSPASAVTVTDALTWTTRRLQLLSLTTSQGQCSSATNLTIDCQLGTLDSGSNAVLTLTVRPSGTGTITDDAQAAAAEFDPDTTDNLSRETTTVGQA
jgi:uncharacterized repeat protein (TIGR01451 family)